MRDPPRRGRRRRTGWITSVGCVGLVVLADGREAAIKVHQPDRSTAFLVDVQTVQRTVVEAGCGRTAAAGPAGADPARRTAGDG